MSKIYTKKGDQGHTQVYLEKTERLAKSDEILQVYGELDELNCHIGLLISLSKTPNPLLSSLQNQLFEVGFAISATSTLSEEDVQAIETEIDRLSQDIPEQRSFILPGGAVSASQSHICRAVCRRAERALVALSEKHQVPAVILQFINRLSDYFFVLARYENAVSGVKDVEKVSR
ncbi:cob(I)yrinic acid a,c-diamide adenosyltransferase [Alteromonas sp. ASW11-130]|uniref:cob(I)yrinic acid a,c-diamide adenosyltransferase n=1 Tax=Alteromonas sp. ASW11-130 TaxID=3015775 RepID=UPI0022419A6A|nr:cob(I)yrinic acid a,c-diamide adenosyltransferase [Alteromonas sp. ASW11-130]MCW8090617.1 cob(I)yrinic acid a,c-diamide adenosyltransferase [Alteromonas sp. ASW11-130]